MNAEHEQQPVAKVEASDISAFTERHIPGRTYAEPRLPSIDERKAKGGEEPAARVAFSPEDLAWFGHLTI